MTKILITEIVFSACYTGLNDFHPNSGLEVIVVVCFYVTCILASTYLTGVCMNLVKRWSKIAGLTKKIKRFAVNNPSVNRDLLEHAERKMLLPFSDNISQTDVDFLMSIPDYMRGSVTWKIVIYVVLFLINLIFI